MATPKQRKQTNPDEVPTLTVVSHLARSDNPNSTWVVWRLARSDTPNIVVTSCAPAD